MPENVDCLVFSYHTQAAARPQSILDTFKIPRLHFFPLCTILKCWKSSICLLLQSSALLKAFVSHFCTSAHLRGLFGAGLCTTSRLLSAIVAAHVRVASHTHAQNKPRHLIGCDHAGHVKLTTLTALKTSSLSVIRSQITILCRRT